jgi:sulfite oxidase
METVNRPDEWKIEQGLSGAKLPFLDQTGSETIAIAAHKWEGFSKDEAAIKAVGDPGRSNVFLAPANGSDKPVCRSSFVT